MDFSAISDLAASTGNTQARGVRMSRDRWVPQCRSLSPFPVSAEASCYPALQFGVHFQAIHLFLNIRQVLSECLQGARLGSNLRAYARCPHPGKGTAGRSPVLGNHANISNRGLGSNKGFICGERV